MGKYYTRRHFLTKVALGGITVATGCIPLKGIFKSNGSKKGTLRFVFFADVHARTEWNTLNAVNLAANVINSKNPDLIIAGGDLITDGFQSSAETVAPRWDVYLAMHKAINGYVYPVLGNHDLVAAIPDDGTPPSDDPRAIYRNIFNITRTYFSFDAVGYHFVVLDSIRVTHDKLKYNGFIGDEQTEWLKEDLAKVSSETPVVLITHIPILTAFYSATKGATYSAPRNRVVVNNTEVLDLFRKNNLILVLQGHLHVRELVRWRRTTFITGGAVCAKWWRGPYHGTEEGFCVISLHGNYVEWEYIDYGWEARRPKNL